MAGIGKGLQKVIDDITTSGALICPFAAAAGGWTGQTAALSSAIPCGAWCKLYDNEKKDCRLVLRVVS
jgi:hypothetical protein